MGSLVEINHSDSIPRYFKMLELAGPHASCLKAIYEVCGERLRDAIQSAINNTADKPQKVNFLKAVGFATSPMVCNGLQSMGFRVDPRAQVLIAQNSKIYQKFKSLFAIAVEGNSVEQEELCSLLRNVLVEWNESSRPSEPSANPAPPSIDCVPDAPSAHQLSSLSKVIDQRQPEDLANEEKPRSPRMNVRPSIHAYGSKGAVCFSFATRGGEITINIEGALKAAGGQFDWGSKINILMHKNEIPAVLAVMLGLCSQVEGKAHGLKNDKAFTIKVQEQQIFVSLRQGTPEMIVPVPMSFADAFWVALRMQEVITEAMGITVETLMFTIKRFAEFQNAREKQNVTTNRSA